MIKLKEDFKTKWLAALRSGDYEQYKNYLGCDVGSKKKKRCCLGVALDVLNVPILVSGTRYLTYGTAAYNTIQMPMRKHVKEMMENPETDPDELDPWRVRIKPDFPGYSELFERYITLGFSYEYGAMISVSLDMLNDNGVSFEMIANVVEYYG